MKWFIESDALEEIHAMLAREVPVSASHSAVAAMDAKPGYSVAEGVATVNVHGPLMARGNPMMKMFGIQHTGYNEILQGLATAEADPQVSSIVLDVNSPGGQASGLFDVTDALKTLSKPVTAIADHAASAAYAIAAATGRIEARGPASSFGSIGVVADMAINDKIVSITSTESPDKRPDPTTEHGRSVIRSQLDDIHDIFVSAIATGRGISASDVNENFGRGRTFLSEEARKRGMIDGIRSGNNAGPGEGSQSANAVEEIKMDLKTLKTDHPDVFAAACSEAVTEERDRVGAHLKMGESSGAMKIALASVLDGSQMTQMLSAEYMSAGLAKRDLDAKGSDDDSTGDALDGKAEASAPDATPQATDFEISFAAELSSLRGTDVTA